jgi:predicted DCC family thiol-disulfide oxidoreductase YuxK
VSSRGFKFETLQNRWDRTHLAGSSGSLPRPAFAEMILELPDGREFGGADAAMEIARHIWWLWPLWLLSRIPGAMMAFRAGYRQIARHRHCLGGGGDLDAPSLKPHRHGAFFEMP